MDDMEEKLGTILNNPQMMQQIMSMAQSMSSPSPGKAEAPAFQENSFPEIDIATIQKISGLARKSSIDQREQALLRALGAYLSKERISKLEKAMRAAKIAKIASSALGQRGVPSHAGR
jgi:hypothetical protein